MTNLSGPAGTELAPPPTQVPRIEISGNKPEGIAGRQPSSERSPTLAQNLKFTMQITGQDSPEKALEFVKGLSGAQSVELIGKIADAAKPPASESGLVDFQGRPLSSTKLESNSTIASTPETVSDKVNNGDNGQQQESALIRTTPVNNGIKAPVHEVAPAGATVVNPADKAAVTGQAQTIETSDTSRGAGNDGKSNESHQTIIKDETTKLTEIHQQAKLARDQASTRVDAARAELETLEKQDISNMSPDQIAQLEAARKAALKEYKAANKNWIQSHQEVNKTFRQLRNAQTDEWRKQQGLPPRKDKISSNVARKPKLEASTNTAGTSSNSAGAETSKNGNGQTQPKEPAAQESVEDLKKAELTKSIKDYYSQQRDGIKASIDLGENVEQNEKLLANCDRMERAMLSLTDPNRASEVTPENLSVALSDLLQSMSINNPKFRANPTPELTQQLQPNYDRAKKIFMETCNRLWPDQTVSLEESQKAINKLAEEHSEGYGRVSVAANTLMGVTIVDQDHIQNIDKTINEIGMGMGSKVYVRENVGQFNQIERAEMADLIKQAYTVELYKDSLTTQTTETSIAKEPVVETSAGAQTPATAEKVHGPVSSAEPEKADTVHPTAGNRQEVREPQGESPELQENQPKTALELQVEQLSTEVKSLQSLLASREQQASQLTTILENFQNMLTQIEKQKTEGKEITQESFILALMKALGAISAEAFKQSLKSTNY